MRSYAATGDPRAALRHAAVAGGDSRAGQPAEATTAKLRDSFAAGHDRKAHPALRTGPGP
jgi:hypothetical protein